MREQTCKCMSLLENFSPENSITADRGVLYGGTIDSLINS